MNWVHPTAVLLAPLLVAFAQCRFDGLRNVLAAQPDLLPALVVYAALSGGLSLTTGTAVVAGIATDALSSGPFGASVVPLVFLGVVLHRRRDLLLRESVWAQALLGGGATLAVAILSTTLLYALWPLVSTGLPSMPYFPEQQPGLSAVPGFGVHTLWKWAVVTAAATAATPAIFRLFRWIEGAFQYRRVPESVYRANREIKRGRF